MIKPKSRDHALKCANSAAQLCVQRTFADDAAAARERACTAMAYAILAGAKRSLSMTPGMRAELSTLFEDAGIRAEDAEQLGVLEAYLEVVDGEDSLSELSEDVAPAELKLEHEHCNGPIRRDGQGRWFYGTMQFGIGEKHDANEFERAVGLYRDGAVPTFEPWTAPPTQCALPFPRDPPPLADVDRTKTVRQAHAELWETLNDGTFCPVCQRDAHRRERGFHAEMASTLVHLVAAFLKSGEKQNYLKLRLFVPGNLTATKASSDCSYLVEWSLLKRHPVKNGYYLPTRAGMAFVRGRTRVPRSAWIYNGHADYFSRMDVSILDVLGPNPDIVAKTRALPGFEEP